MKTSFHLLLFLFIISSIPLSAQSKKEIKKFKIKAITITATDINADGNEKSRTDSYQKFDANYCQFTFEYPKYASIEQDKQFFDEKSPSECWFNI